MSCKSVILLIGTFLALGGCSKTSVPKSSDVAGGRSYREKCQIQYWNENDIETLEKKIATWKKEEQMKSPAQFNFWLGKEIVELSQFKDKKHFVWEAWRLKEYLQKSNNSKISKSEELRSFVNCLEGEA